MAAKIIFLEILSTLACYNSSLQKNQDVFTDFFNFLRFVMTS